MKKDKLISSIKKLLSGSNMIRAYAIIGSTANNIKNASTTLDLSKDIDILVISDTPQILDFLASYLEKEGLAQDIKKSEDGVFCTYENLLYHFSGFSNDEISSMLLPMISDGELETKIKTLASQQRPWTVFGWHTERLAYDILSAFIIYDEYQIIRQHQQILIDNWSKLVFYVINYNIHICKSRFEYLSTKVSADVLLITVADIMVCVHRVLTIDLLSRNNALAQYHSNELVTTADDLNKAYTNLPLLLKLYQEDNLEYMLQVENICTLLNVYKNYYQTNLKFNV